MSEIGERLRRLWSNTLGLNPKKVVDTRDSLTTRADSLDTVEL